MARILVADDDAHTVRVLSLWLTRQGHEVIEARDGASAIAALDGPEGDQIEMIISDMNMPTVNGLELLRTVRHGRGESLPFLMLSSRCDQTDLARALEPHGAVLFPKPFVPSKLVICIDNLLESRRSSPEMGRVCAAPGISGPPVK